MPRAESNATTSRRARVLAWLAIALLAVFGPTFARAQPTKTTAAASASVSAIASASASTTSSATASAKPGSAIKFAPEGSASGVIGPEVPNVPQIIPDASPFDGKPIVSIQAKVHGALWTHPPTIVSPKVGEKFSLAKANAVLHDLLAGGGFATGSLDVASGQGGVDVTFKLVPSRFVRRIVWHGNVLTEEEVERAAGLIDVRDVTEASLDTATQGIKTYYARRGWPRTRVEISTIETDNPLTVIVDVRVEPGKALEVAARTFVGLPTWDDDAVDAAHAYAVKVGDRADEDDLDAADKAMSNALRGAGFPNALVSHTTTPSTTMPDGGVDVAINVVAGSRVVTVFEGNLAYDREDLLRILDLGDEADRSPAHLAAKIEAAYVQRGYLDVHVTTDFLGNVGDKERALIFRVREGEVVRVKKRIYPCLYGALDAARLDEEIDSYLDEELEGGGFGDVDPSVSDQSVSSNGDVQGGARPWPNAPDPSEVYAPDTYDRAVEHLRDLFRSEGYIFAEVGDPTIVRAACGPGSQPGACKETTLPPLPAICRTDLDQLPQEALPIPKSYTCLADPSKGTQCSTNVTIVIPVNPGPRSILWDIAFDGTRALSPELLGGSKVAGQDLRLGDPLSLRDVESARHHVLDWYKDEGYFFANVRATLEYSPDKSRARVRFIVSEGEQVVVDHIYVEGNKLTLESLIRARMSITEGGIYRQKWVNTSQERLAQLNVFSSVNIGLVNPSIPAKHKNVIVTVVERKPQHVEIRAGYSTGEGVRGFFEYGYGNLFGYAVSLDFRAKVSYQPFLGCFPSGDATASSHTNAIPGLSATTKTGETAYNCGASGLYDPDVVRRWNNQLTPGERVPHRVSVLLTLPHSPIFGTPVRTTVELVNSLDLYRDFKLNRYTPVLTLTYTPVRWFTAIFAGDLEYNDFKLFDAQQLNTFLSDPTNFARFGTLLRVPDGATAVGATRATMLFDWRDNRLGATKNGFVSFTTEYVRSIITPPTQENPFGPQYQQVQGPIEQFLHLTASTGAYFKLSFLPKSPVLAIEIAGGGNFNVLGCAGEPQIAVPSPTGSQVQYIKRCDIYLDRLFYLGGIDSSRGFLVGQMTPQDVVDDIISKGGDYQLARVAPRGGEVYINPRIELRVPAFKWGGFVLFLDAANSWKDRTRFLRDANGNFAPLRLRYAVGPGLSIDTPVGPLALDFGFNLTRYDLFDEPLVAFHFSIGRF